MRPLQALDIRPVGEGFTAHLGFSAHNAKSKGLMQQLQAAYPDVATMLVSDSSDFGKCEMVVVVLAHNCFLSEKYQEHVGAAMEHRTNTDLVIAPSRSTDCSLCSFRRCCCMSRLLQGACHSARSCSSARHH